MKTTNIAGSRRAHTSAPGAQRGVTLIVVLLILMVVMVIGVAGAQIALLGERTTRYDRDYLVASQAAEAALLDAEFDIRGPGGTRMSNFGAGLEGLFMPNCGSSGTSVGLCAPKPDSVKPVWVTVDWNDTSASARTVEFGTFTGRTFDSGLGVRPARAPRYVIEVLDDASYGNNAATGQTPKIYRVTAMGFGPNANVQVVMQMMFRKERI